MKNNLYQAAKEYAEVMETIEKTSNPNKLQLLEVKKGRAALGFYGVAEKTRNQIQRQRPRNSNRDQNCE